MGTGLFWGALLLIAGIVLIIKVIFNIEIPVFKILVGIFFIFIGLKVLFGRVLIPEGKIGPEETIFNERIYDEPQNGKEYSVIFGKGVYDFTNVDLSQGNFNVKISTVFGGTVIKIDQEMPLKIEADAVFAGAELPDGNTAVFGSSSYATESYRRDSSSLNIKLDVVFGGAQVLRK
ncbi:MAG: cell wall-active antibiotics response protein [Bacteroidales bacterium]|nr:cell wall-active antibiotics response protein [Bacteroidales bacterium]